MPTGRISSAESPSYLLKSYREFRRGILSLPRLEEIIMSDIAILRSSLDKETATQLEFETVVQGLHMVNDFALSTSKALANLRDFVDSDDQFADLELMESIASEKINDPDILATVLGWLRTYGGIQPMLWDEQERLDRKISAYSKAVAVAEIRDITSINEAIRQLESYQGDEIELLTAYWQRKLDEEREQYGEVYVSEVAFELCQRYPEIAVRLGVDCTDVQSISPVIIIIAILCALLCKGDSV